VLAQFRGQLPAHRLDRVERHLEAPDMGASGRIGRPPKNRITPERWEIMCRAAAQR
jgi:hypothetical protein